MSASTLAEQLDRMGCPSANALCRDLDVKQADERDVRERTGFGALIGSLYVRPVEVWRR
jgi:hypothetical protein